MPIRVIIVAGVAMLLITTWLWLAPPRVWSNWVKQVTPTAAVGEQLVLQYNCRSCHHIAGKGALKAPNLAGITQRDQDPTLIALRSWLAAPRTVRPDTAMPNFHLSDSEIDALVTYFQQVDGIQP